MRLVGIFVIMIVIGYLILNTSKPGYNEGFADPATPTTPLQKIIAATANVNQQALQRINEIFRSTATRSNAINAAISEVKKNQSDLANMFMTFIKNVDPTVIRGPQIPTGKNTVELYAQSLQNVVTQTNLSVAPSTISQLQTSLTKLIESLNKLNKLITRASALPFPPDVMRNPNFLKVIMNPPKPILPAGARMDASGATLVSNTNVLLNRPVTDASGARLIQGFEDLANPNTNTWSKAKMETVFTQNMQPHGRAGVPPGQPTAQISTDPIQDDRQGGPKAYQPCQVFNDQFYSAYCD